ncbi:MAG TPA: copper chaperone PCu(A)C [Thermoanaerobaculia bacterium]|nr:copper chaperone PCu(A)C [Thermoanaerobaculia bacterium]
MKSTTMSRLCLSIALLGMAIGCGQRAPAAVGELEIRDARASLMQDMGVVYLTVVNPGPEDDRLLRVETAAARVAETHESLHENGVVRMAARPEGFEVPAGGTLELGPGGKHIMLIEPKTAQEAAGSIPLTLHFERAGAIEVQAVLPATEEMDHSGHSMDHGEHTTESTAEGAEPR